MTKKKEGKTWATGDRTHNNDVPKLTVVFFFPLFFLGGSHGSPFNGRICGLTLGTRNSLLLNLLFLLSMSLRPILIL